MPEFLRRSKMSSLKEMVANGKQVFFVCYDKDLWYKTECGFEFPVSLEDTGDGAFLVSDKASFFMRWINRQLKSGQTVSYGIHESQGNVVIFTRYQKKELWYVTQDGFEFPVSVADVENQVLWNSDNIEVFQNWIDSQKQAIEQAKAEHQAV
jgi:hypothetical protein